MNKINPLIKNASFLGIGALISKILGAIYRIPLTNIIGGLGLGLYQMIFPVYTLLLDFSGYAMPQALSRLISVDNNDKYKSHILLKSSIKLMLLVGSLFSLIMILFSKPISALQGNIQAYKGYICLAPSVLLVSVISCYRGYFQGLMKMGKTAISQIIEQIVKLSTGLILVSLFMPDITMAVAGATFAITLSEAVALIYLVISYIRHRKNQGISCYNLNNKRVEQGLIKKIIKVSFPITMAGILLPLSQVTDSFLIINILKTYMGNATILYGLLSGVAMTVINLPVSLCYGISQVAIPQVAAAKDQREQIKSELNALVITTLISFTATIMTFIFAPIIIKILFHNLNIEEVKVATKLLTMLSPLILLMSLTQTTNGIMVGRGRLYVPLISMSTGVTVKFILNIILLKIEKLNIYAGALSLIACYFTICLINLMLIENIKVKHAGKTLNTKKCAH